MSNGTSSTTEGLLATFVQGLKDDELVTAGPDILAFIQYWSANASNKVGVALNFHRMVAAVAADQATVAQQLQSQGGGVLSTSLSAAIAAAKARQAAGQA